MNACLLLSTCHSSALTVMFDWESSGLSAKVLGPCLRPAGGSTIGFEKVSAECDSGLAKNPWWGGPRNHHLLKHVPRRLPCVVHCVSSRSTRIPVCWSRLAVRRFRRVSRHGAGLQYQLIRNLCIRSVYHVFPAVGRVNEV